RLPLIARLSAKTTLLLRVIAASIVMYFAANALLFRLYLPSRFTVSSFRIILALASGICAIVLVDAVFQLAAATMKTGSTIKTASPFAIVPGGADVLALIVALFIPRYASGTWVDTRYKTGRSPELYEFLSRQPKDVLVASLSSEADNIPSFARRPVLVARETALPFHKGY